MSNTKLGIHLAPGAIKLVELEEQAKKFRVLNYSIDYFPPEGGPDSQIKDLVSSIKKNKIRTRQANLVVSGADIVYKLIELPEISQKDISSAIKYKLKTALPASFKEVVIDYYRIEKLRPKGKQLFFVAAAPKEKILDATKIIKAAGLSLRDILAPSAALRNALGASTPEPGALIYLGRYSSLIILVKQGQVVFAREMSVGGDDITQAMVGVVQTERERLELDYKRAEEIKNKYGIPVDLEKYSSEAGVPASELLAMMRPALEKIGAEILNTFDYYRQEIGDETEFKKIYFSGGTSKTRNLSLYFREQLGLEIFPLPLKIESMKKDFAENAPFLSMAVGAVIRGKDHLSLMPREERLVFVAGFISAFMNIMRRWFKIVFLGLVYLLILASVFGWFYVQQRDLSATHQTLQKNYQERMQKLGKKAGVGLEIADLLKYSRRDRFTLVMHALDKIAPGDIYFKNLSYDNKTNQLAIKGIMVKSRGKISMPAFIQGLNKSRYFKSIDLVYLEESDLYTVPTYDFELKCLLAGESKK